MFTQYGSLFLLEELRAAFFTLSETKFSEIVYQIH